MFNFRPTYEPLITFCKELIAEKKALMEENEELKEMLESTRQDLFYARGQNRFLSESLADLQNEKRKDLEKRVADLEDRLSPPELKAESAEEKLEVGKWYDTRTFDVATLKKLLPVGTLVEITESLTADESVKERPKVKLEKSRVTKVVAEDNILGVTDTVIYVERFMHVSCNWFKIIEEY